MNNLICDCCKEETEKTFKVGGVNCCSECQLEEEVFQAEQKEMDALYWSDY